jgi:hypothetical protein
MPEQTVFIHDTSPGMSVSDKNMQLSAELANAPNNGRDIVRINRDDPDTGWIITYLENFPR